MIGIGLTLPNYRADDPRPFHGSPGKIVDSIKHMEELGLELIVLAPNLLPAETSLDVVDQIASEVMAKVQE
jgi:hypothetical protein